MSYLVNSVQSSSVFLEAWKGSSDDGEGKLFDANRNELVSSNSESSNRCTGLENSFASALVC